METEAFQDFMDHSFYDCSTDGGSESGENSEKRPDYQQYPDSSSSCKHSDGWNKKILNSQV